MNQAQTISILPEDFNKSVFGFYLILFAVLSVCGLGYMVWKGKFLYLLLILFAPAFVLIVVRPKLALFQYTFFLFVSQVVIESIPLTITDIAGIVIIVAGALDFLLNQSKSGPVPKLSFNFIFLIIALFICAVFAYDTSLAFRAMTRVILLFAVFLSIVRLIKRTGIEYSLKLFFWLCVIHSISVIVPFVLSGGGIRSFGLAVKFFDDLSMLTFPMGMALYLWSEKGRGLKYLLGSFIVLGALISTQSRGAFIFCMILTAIVFLFSYLRARKLDGRNFSLNSSPGSLVFKRQILAVSTGVGASVLLIVLIPEIFEAVMFRFTDLYSKIKIGTVLTRFELWQNAFNAFLEHPLVGIGPGNYKMLHSIYPTIRLDFIHFYVQGMNAHNLLLHYMAETGVVGTTAMMALIFNQLRSGRQGWKESFGLKNLQITGALYITSIMFMVTTILEADWLWGFAGYTFVFFLALIVSNQRAVAKI